jgi:hypothetical protein
MFNKSIREMTKALEKLHKNLQLGVSLPRLPLTSLCFYFASSFGQALWKHV